MRAALKLGLFLGWLGWLVFVFLPDRFDNLLLNVAAALLAAGLTALLYVAIVSFAKLFRGAARRPADAR